MLAVAVNADRLTQSFDAALCCSCSQVGSRLPLCQCACMSTFSAGGGVVDEGESGCPFYCSVSFEMENARVLVSAFCFPDDAETTLVPASAAGKN